MGYFDAFTATLFRSDDQNRRVYAPFGRWGTMFLVPNDRAAEMSRAIRRFHVVMLSATIGTEVTYGWRYAVFLVAPMLFIGFCLLSWRLTRGLQTLPRGGSNLLPVARREALLVRARATGRPVLWTLVCGSALMTSLSVLGASHAGDLRLWLGSAFFAACGGVFAIQLWLTRSSDP